MTAKPGRPAIINSSNAPSPEKDRSVEPFPTHKLVLHRYSLAIECFVRIFEGSRTVFLIVGVLLFGLVSCVQNTNLTPSQSALERQVIAARTQAWLKAEQAKDLDASLSFSAEDGVYLAAQWPALKGREEISAFLKAAFDLPMISLTGAVDKIEASASGDLAYEVGHTEAVYANPEGEQTLKSHYLVVWKKRDGMRRAIATSISTTP